MKFPVPVLMLISLRAAAVMAATNYVSLSGSHISPFASWATAANDIQSAVDAAASGDTVLVDDGHYVLSNQIMVSKEITVESVNGADITVVDGNDVTRCFTLVGSACRIRGFTITNGYASDSGGGVYSNFGSANRVENCIITGNRATYGGGMHSGTLSNCIVSANQGVGGGMNSGSAENCVVSGNTALNGGGGFSGVVAKNCTVTGNSGRGSGGGVSGGQSLNGIVWHNLPDDLSGAVVSNTCSPDVTHGADGCITNDPALASSSHIAPTSPCRGAGSSVYASGVDVDGSPWLTPPSMGCDEKSAGETVSGPIEISLAGPRSLVSGYSGEYSISVIGQVSQFIADFANGVVLTNTLVTSSTWTAPGCYEVVVTAWNDDHPAGVSITQSVQIANPEECVVFVSATGDDANAGTHWADAKATIQAGVDAQAFAGGTVRVGDGLYQTSAAIKIQKMIRLESLNGAAFTTVDGGGAHLCFELGRSACVLSGFTITNGSGYYGAAVSCDDLTPVVEECALTGNNAQGGYVIDYGTLRNCSISDNFGTATYYSTLEGCTVSGNSGGGTLFGRLRDCTVAGNGYVGVHSGLALNSLIVSNAFGGLYNTTATNCTIACNSTISGGGGCNNSDLYNCIVSNNVAASSGGGINQGSATECVITGNSSTNSSGGGACNATLINCTVTGNSAEFNGGGLEMCAAINCLISANSAGADGGGLSESSAENCTVSGNTADGNGGGFGRGSACNCMISGNSAHSGGGAYACTVRNSAVSGNEAAADGGGLFLGSANNCTVAANRASLEGGGVRDVTVQNCIIWDNGPDNISGGSAGYTCAPSLTHGSSGNITNAPALLSATHISAGSPCVGRGNSAYASGTDIDGAAWLNPPSIGCDERHPGDPSGGGISLDLVGPNPAMSGYAQLWLVSVMEP